MLGDEESQSLASLSDFIKKPLSLHPDTQYGREESDIVWI